MRRIRSLRRWSATAFAGLVVIVLVGYGWSRLRSPARAVSVDRADRLRLGA